MKINGVIGTAEKIKEDYLKEDAVSRIEETAFKNSLLIMITDASGNIIFSSDEHGFGIQENIRPGINAGNFPNNPRPLPRDYPEFLEKILSGEEKYITYKVTQFGFGGQTLIYGSKIGEDILYISTPLDPVNATTSILRTQLLYVTILALLLGFVIAYFISKKLSKPISQITRSAAELAAGNYEVRFRKGEYAEIDKLAETLNYTARELSRVENLRRELIANISHDFRTPLTMIKSYSEMIRDISGENKEKREKHLRVIIEESDRLTLLVNDILELSLVQAGEEKARFENINLSDITRKTLSRFEPLAEKEGYIIKSTIGSDLYVFADGLRMEQVLYNLIGNAVNYIGDDKTIEVSLSDRGSRVRFEVRDFGAGIPKDEIPYIWERYYRVKTHRRAALGTGLGLSIVKGILELHKAGYGVESSVGQGSRFWFEINK